MSRWRSTKAKRVLAALRRNGWEIKRSSGSHRTLAKEGCPDFVFAFHDSEEIKMLTQVDVKRLPSYQLGYEDGEAHGEARGAAKTQRHVVRQLLAQLDASRVAELLGLDIAEVARIAGAQDGDAAREDQQPD